MQTREDWLLRAVEELRKLFDEVDLKLPDEVKVSCGFPSTRGLNGRLGESWAASASKDGLHQVFVTPLLYDSVKVLEVLTHELVHCSLPEDTKHGKAFKAAMTKVGLEGPAKATYASPGLLIRLEDIAEELGAYPNAGIDPKDKERKKQTTRMLKLICGSNTEHKQDIILRGTKKALEFGSPICACGKEFKIEEMER